MKHALELPKEEDFLKTTFVVLKDTPGNIYKESDAIKYNRGKINLSSIIDFVEANVTLNVIDEQKFPEYQKTCDEIDRQSGINPHASQNRFIEYPPMPIRQVKIQGTGIHYYNGSSRIIADKFDDFDRMYMRYLEKERLQM